VVCDDGRSRLGSTFDQSNIAGAGALRRVLRAELHALTLAKQLEHRASHCASMEEVLDAPFIADKPKTLVNEEPCDCARWHTEFLQTKPSGHPDGSARTLALGAGREVERPVS
jgi:hypothetical protein